MSLLQILHAFLNGALARQSTQFHLVVIKLAGGWNKILQYYSSGAKMEIISNSIYKNGCAGQYLLIIGGS